MGEELTVEVIKQLPLAVVAIIACIALWRALSKRIEEHINDLREDKKEDINDLRARVMAVEDHLHISRSDRMKYIPSLTMPTGKEIKDLD
jgi:choline-glycine betaine transporter